nr:hypothetical protein CFP56_45631 [Quercus suber]
MAKELEELWKKLTFTEEEDKGIDLDSRSTSAARKVFRLFLVEFGDEKDKKKVLDMCPWNYEKQLILIQEYVGELTLKEIEVKWAPFWVQIYNLPLNSRTKETGWAIGSCLETVLDVDVTEVGVQWGKCLRVRVRIDVTKRLVRGKKISTEGVSYPIRDVGAVTTPKPVSEMLPEEGKVKEMEGKIEEKVTDLGRFGEEKSAVKPGLMEGMQWEIASCQVPKLIPDGSLAPQELASGQALYFLS